MQVVLLVGPPGSGKGQQSEVLVGEGYVHLSTGDVLRRVITDPQHPMHDQIKEQMAAGKLVADDLIVSLVKDYLEGLPKDAKVVFDGFPRTLSQAETMVDMGLCPQMLICLVCDDELLHKRISGRWSDPASGRVYNTYFNPPKNPGVDDISGEPLVQRPDDREDVVADRIKTYQDKTYPMVPYFLQKGFTDAVRVVFIDASADIASVSGAVRSLLSK